MEENSDKKVEVSAAILSEIFKIAKIDPPK